MKTFLAIFVILSAIFLMGLVTYVDSAGEGSPRLWPQVVAAAPAQPYACVVAHRGRMIYVDDNNDTLEAFTCFCGVDADDATYVWLRTANPAANCF
jgi:hypothetical protein